MIYILIFHCLSLLVLSATMDPTQSTGTDASSSLAVVPYDINHLSIFHQKERSIDIGIHTIVISQNWQQGGVAAVLWDAAIVLGEFIANEKELIFGKTCIELGAGTGLVGMVAALNGAKTVDITDRQVALEALTENVNINLDPAYQKKVHIKDLTWGENLTNFPSKYDIILGADIIYIEDTFSDLLETMLHLSDCHTIMFVSCRIRYDRDNNFLDMLKMKFSTTEVFYDKNKDIHIFRAVLLC